VQTRHGWLRNSFALIAAGCLLVACTVGTDDDSPEAPAAESNVDPAQEDAGPEGEEQEDEVSQSNVDIVCPSSADENGYMTVDGFREGLNCVVQLFAWPMGKMPDGDMIDQIAEGYEGSANARFEAGLEYTRMGGLNSCAWSMEWLDDRQSGDSEGEAAALEYLTQVVPDYRTSILQYPDDAIDQTTINSLQRIADQAELGDPSLVQEYVTRDCGPIEWPES